MIQIEKDGETRNCHNFELKRMARQGWTPQEETNPSQDKEGKRFEDIKQAVSLVLEAGAPKDINANGYPDVRAVEKLLGFDITPEERDRAYQSIMEIGGAK